MKVMLAGDVMLGRGIDQIQPHPAPPEIYERFVGSALDYVALAERESGAIPRGVAPAYVWGDALPELDTLAPDLRIVNLETAATLSDDYLPKGINYRMNPANLSCLNAASIDCCVLANNHVLDWGKQGLSDTLEALKDAGIDAAGAGRDTSSAAEPAILQPPGGARLVLHAVACPTSGVPQEWAAREDRPGVHWVTGWLDETAHALAHRIAKENRRGDITAVSIHWGGNWGYEISEKEREFAHFLIEEAGVDLVHGHSSHHPRAIEIHRERTILYGCGDLINDYEGISGHDEYRSELVLVFIVTLEADGRFADLEMLPYRLRKFRLNRAADAEREWLAKMLDRECRLLGTQVEARPDGRLGLVRR